MNSFSYEGKKSFLPYKLEILLTTHAEEIELERTLRNLFECIDYAKKKAIFSNINVLCTLDNGKEQTRAILNRYQDRIKLFEVNFGDLGNCRNFLIQKAEADFVHTWDADDFVAIDALVKIGKYLNDYYQGEPLENLSLKQHIALFPKYLIEFPKFHLQEYVDSNELIKVNLLFEHTYISRLCLPLVVARQFLYKANTAFFAYEDWDYNLQLLYAGISFKVVDYRFYYRKKTAEKSLNLQQKGKIQHYSSVFDVKTNLPILDQIGSYEEYWDTKQVKKELFKQKIKRIIKKILLFVPFGDFIKQKLLTFFIGYKNIRAKIKFKNDLINNNILQIFGESKKFLSDYSEILVKNGFSWNNCTNRGMHFLPITFAFYQLKALFEGVEIILFVPWVTKGGADKLILEYAQSLHEQGYKVLVVTTLSKGEWLDRLPCKTAYLGDFLPALLSSDESLKAALYALLSCKPKCIHVVNSEWAWELYKNYGKLLQAHGIGCFASLYSPALIKGKYGGYPVVYKDSLAFLDGIITDNAYWIPYYESLSGATQNNFIKIPAPVSDSFLLHNKKKWSNKILWASRISDQKLPQVLLKIAKALPSYTFYVYGTTHEVSEHFLAKLSALKNVRLLGAFENINQIPVQEYDCFLYTSAFDGIPNVLLEMISFGIPIVSSRVAGAPEVLGEEYLYFVEEIENEKAYIEKIIALAQNSLETQKQMFQIRARVLKIHNKQNFDHLYLKTLGLKVGSF